MKRGLLFFIALSLIGTVLVCSQSSRDDMIPIISGPCIPHRAPTNLTTVGLRGTIGHQSNVLYVHMEWVPGDNSDVGDDIERSLDGVTFEHINMGYGNGVYNDTYELLPSTIYHYRVRVSARSDHACASAYSNVSSTMTPP